MKSYTLGCLLLVLTACNQPQKEETTAQATSIPSPPVPPPPPPPPPPPVSEDYSPTFEKAHPKAKRLMNDEYFFDVLQESAPFGNDDGADAYARFRDWRAQNRSGSPVAFVHLLIERWGYAKFDMQETSYEKLEPFLNKRNINADVMTGTDMAIIAVAFGQLYLEGKVDADIKNLAKTAITRELLPDIIKGWGESEEKRRKNLNKLLKTLNKV